MPLSYGKVSSYSLYLKQYSGSQLKIWNGVGYCHEANIILINGNLTVLHTKGPNQN